MTIELIGFTIINLIILALNLKMYTEYFKDKAIDKRTNNSKETSQIGIRTASLYNELIMEVAQKFPGETRHETALRYIRERESKDRGSESCKENR